MFQKQRLLISQLKLFENVDALKIRLCTVPEGFDFSACSKTLPLSNLLGLQKVGTAFKNINNEGTYGTRSHRAPNW